MARACSPAPAVGRDGIVAWFETNHGPRRRGKHVGANTVVDVDGDRAVVVSDFVFYGWKDARLLVRGAGRYHDALVRVDDGWRFVRREAELAAPAE